MTTNTQCFRRVQSRNDERGAAILVVVLVITLLSAVGVFALRSASLINVASGFNRQATQTMFMAEFGARTAAAAITNAPGALLDELKAQTETAGTIPKCKGTAAVAAYGVVPCVVYDKAYIFNHLTNDSVSAVDALPGVMGLGETRADFHVEIFSLAPSGSWTAGNPISDDSHRVTIQAEARIRPAPAGDNSAACNPATTPATSIQTLRAHLIFVKEGS